jgi:hypothetical protein
MYTTYLVLLLYSLRRELTKNKTVQKYDFPIISRL